MVEFFKKTTRPLLIICLLSFFWLGVDTALDKNPTADEPVHLTRGVALWQGEDLRLQQEHTPLSHWLIGALLRTEPDLPKVRTLPGWPEGDRLQVARTLVWGSGLDVDRLFFLGRLPLLWLAVLLASLLAGWIGRRGGQIAALFATALFSFSPNLIAHSAVATTDFTATAGYLIALFTASRYARRPSWWTWGAAGLALGFGLAAKMTGLLLLPLVFAIVWGRTVFTAKSAESAEIFSAKKFATLSARAAVRFLLLLPLAGFVLWTAYRFSWGPVFIPQLGATLSLPVPAYWGSLLGVNAHIGEGHRAFFLGEIGQNGWWLYFAVALAVKTPLTTLLLAGLSVWQAAKKQRWLRDLPFWLPPLALFTIASLSRLNIGYRHILPLLPLLQGWIGLTLGRIAAARPQSRRRLALLLLLLTLIPLPALAIHPHFLAFFNLAAGGPAQGARYLGDSNLDWGQDWRNAALYVNTSSPSSLFYLPFGFVAPDYYGLDGRRLVDEEGFAADWFPAANPPAGTYLLSVNALQGIVAEPDLLDWFRRREPDEKRATGYSIYVYDVDAPAAGGWIAHCTDPGPLLSPDEAEQLVGRTGLRHLYFNCREGWVFPGGDEGGWYVLPLQKEPWWPQTAAATNSLPEQYAHRATAFAPSYEIAHSRGLSITNTFSLSGGRLPLNEQATFLGYIRENGRWITFWQATAATTEPLSVLGHLYAAPDDPQPAAVDDGLAFPTNQWRPGDIFAQYHDFPPDQTGQLETALYNYTTGARLGQTIRLPQE